MSKTRAQLIEGALRELGALPAGQSAAPEDAQTVDAAVNPLMASLAKRNIYVWGDPDQFDDEAFLPLGTLLANARSVARAFGLQPDPIVTRVAENDLRLLDVQVLSGQPLKTEYF